MDKSASPSIATGSVDQYEVGDLSGKFGDLKGQDRVQGTFVDPSLCLWGPNSVLGRSVVIHHSPVPHRWVCANIELDHKERNAKQYFQYFCNPKWSILNLIRTIAQANTFKTLKLFSFIYITILLIYPIVPTSNSISLTIGCF